MVINIELKRKPYELILRGACILIAIVTAVLLFFSLKFSIGEEAPMFFGKNIYIVKTNTFPQVVNGSAIIVSKTDFESIQPGNIVIFQNSEKKAGIAEIRTSNIVDGVYTFTAQSDRGTNLTLSQGQIVGKAEKYSMALGNVIGFATSPLGVLVIAILPCSAVIANEFIKLILEKIANNQSVRPVKKQDEIPTYAPTQKSAAINAYKKVENQATAMSVDYDSAEEFRRKKPAYRANDLLDIENAPEEPFFNRNQRGVYSGSAPITPNAATIAMARAPRVDPLPKSRTMPVSQQRLFEVMEQTSPRGGRNTPEPQQRTPQRSSPISEPRPAQRPAPQKQVDVVPIPTASARPSAPQQRIQQQRPPRTADRTAEIDLGRTGSIMQEERVRRFTPKRQQVQPTKVASSTASIPRLDQLLSDENEAENTRYDIEDILNSLDRR